MNRSLADWQTEIGAWHVQAFPWAEISHVLDKLDEENREAIQAWANGKPCELTDELADCLICVLAAMAREGIDADLALASKLPRVMAKYGQRAAGTTAAAGRRCKISNRG